MKHSAIKTPYERAKAAQALLRSLSNDVPDSTQLFDAATFVGEFIEECEAEAANDAARHTPASIAYNIAEDARAS